MAGRAIVARSLPSKALKPPLGAIKTNRLSWDAGILPLATVVAGVLSDNVLEFALCAIVAGSHAFETLKSPYGAIEAHRLSWGAGILPLATVVASVLSDSVLELTLRAIVTGAHACSALESPGPTSFTLRRPRSVGELPRRAAFAVGMPVLAAIFTRLAIGTV